MVSWFTEKLSSRDKVVIKSTRKADCCVGRLSLKKLLLAAFDLCTSSHVQWFDVFISPNRNRHTDPACRGCITQKPPVDKSASMAFSFSLQSHLWRSTVAVLRFALFVKRAQRVSLPAGTIIAGKIEGLR